MRGALAGSSTVAIAARMHASAAQSRQAGASPSRAMPDSSPTTGISMTDRPLATGGSLAHVLTIDYALRPVLAALGARHVTAGRFVLDSSVERGSGPDRLRPEAELDLYQAVDEFAAALRAAPAAAVTAAALTTTP